MYETINYETPENGIGILTLNRPHLYNAMSQKMFEELTDFWKERLFDLDTKVIVLRGSGEKGFCGGWDLKEAAEITKNMTIPQWYRMQMRGGRMILAMRQAPQPIICAVHGSAAGGGFSLALASDIRIITPDARFNAAYVNLGLGGADIGSSYFLPRMIGCGRAYEFLYTGEFMSAQEAMALGFVSKIVERGVLMDTAMEYARKLMTKNPMALRLTKEAINTNIDCAGLESALQMEDRNQSLLAVGVFIDAPKVDKRPTI